MNNIGIICEYNPLHGGHKYLIERVKKETGGRIICIMSGNAVQRGELALLPKNYRAEMALCAGANVVIELPFPYSAASAEFFATAAVGALARLGVDTIAFGSESGDIDKLSIAAERAILYRESEHSGEAFSTGEYFSQIGLDGASNDILAIEYIKAAKKIAPTMSFFTVKREGAGYRGEGENGEFPSATQLRKSIEKNGIRATLEMFDEKQLPPETRREMLLAEQNGECPITPTSIESVPLAFWRLADAALISRCAECTGGVAERLISAAREARSLEEMMTLAATKRYTDAKLRRAVLFGMLGVTPDDLRREVAYVELLGADNLGREMLSEMRRGELEVISKPSRIPKGEDALRQFELSRRLDALFTLALPSKKSAAAYLKISPIVN